MKIKIAGICCTVNPIYPATEKYCAEYFSEEEAKNEITITPSDIEFEREKSRVTDEREGNPGRVQHDEALEPIALQRKLTELLFEQDTLLFHGSVIAVNGKAFLFTAKSGTGKSTHTRLWRQMLGERAVMVNDDKPYITVKDGEVIVHGSPWNGKHKLGRNISVPLRAICILERGEINKIEEIPASKAIYMLMQQSSRPQNAALMPKYMELLDGLAQGVKFYRLACNMDPEAARVSFEGMTRDN